MKRITIVGVCLLALCLWVLGACPASAEAADSARTFIWNGAALQSDDQTAAFWEYPQLIAGQTRTNGTLTFINQSLGAMTVDLSDVQRPYDDEAALAYLGALRLTVRDGDCVLYNGIFSHINDNGLAEPITVSGGETRTLSIDLSCDFAYTGDASCGEQVIYWNFETSASLMRSVLDLWMFWAPALLLIVVLIVVLRLRRTRAKKPAAAPAALTEPEEHPLPPGVPRPAPRKTVTLQLDPTKAPKPERRKQPKPERPAAPKAERHAAPKTDRHAAPKTTGRHKAAHAAPRHAKKK